MSIQTTLFLVLYCTYLLAHGTLAITKCGFPGKPPNGNISPEVAIYSENETVSYSCPQFFNLFGIDSEKRICSRNGSWTGLTPICMPNIVHKSETITVYPSSGDGSQNNYLVDDLLSPCLVLQPVRNTRWVRIGLERKLGVRLIKLFSQKNTEFSVKVSVVDTLTNKSKLCGSHKGDSDGSGIRIFCNAPEDNGFQGGIPGDIILIEELDAGDKPLVFCDIEAYAFDGNTDCGSAEAPAYGSAEYVGTKQVEYKCQSGFTLIGPKYRYCDPGGDGTYWPSSTTPICINLEKWQESFNTGKNCTALESHIANAWIYYKYGRSVAIVECKDGFELIADKVLLCTSFGVWLRYADHGLHCKHKVICGEPPSISNTILANIQGYSEGSQATYLCNNLADPANYQRNRRDLRLQSSATFSQAGVTVHVRAGPRLGISNCRANGTWSDLPSKFICQVPTTTTTELVIGTSRRENLTECLEHLNSTTHNLLEPAGEISWKSAIIGVVIGTCISTILFSFLACCYFCTRQQRPKTEDETYSMHSQSHLEKDKRTGNGYDVSHAKEEIQNDPLSNEYRPSNLYDEIISF